MRQFDLSEQTLQAQLGQLNEKVRVYVGRLWQLPFAYLTVTGVFLLQDSAPKLVGGATGLLILLGLLSLQATWQIHRRINQTVKDIEEVEDALSLNRTVVRWTPLMTAPYYAILLLGILAAAGALWVGTDSEISAPTKAVEAELDRRAPAQSQDGRAPDDF